MPVPTMPTGVFSFETGNEPVPTSSPARDGRGRPQKPEIIEDGHGPKTKNHFHRIATDRGSKTAAYGKHQL